MTRAAVLPIFAAAIAAAQAAAQPAAQPATQDDTPRPTFRSGTRLVEVDVVARSNGAPAIGLTKDDFTLLDNGKPQKIAFFSVQSGSVPALPAVGVAPLAAEVVFNRSEPGGHPAGNTTVLLLDQRNTPVPEQAFAIQRIARFMADRAMDMRRRQDETGIYIFTKDGIKAVQEITANTELLSRAAASLKARDPDFRSPDASGSADRPTARSRGAPDAPSPLQGHAADEFTELLIRLREVDTTEILERLASHLADVPGRKSLIWIGSGFPVSWRDTNFTRDIQEVARKLNDASVAVYAVDPRGVGGALSGATSIANAEYGGVHTQEQIVALMIGEGRFPAPLGSGTMGLLASLTGGLAFGNDNGIEKLIQAAAEDGQFTYTLGFYPAPEARDGVRHSLRVLVSKPGIGLRYRLNYLASEAATANDRPALQQLLTDARDSLRVELSASATPDEANPRSWQVKVHVSIGDLNLTHDDAIHAGGIDVSFHVEGTGKVITKTLKIAIPDDQFGAFLGKGIDTGMSIDATGGAGAVRVVVQDRSTGAAGSLTVPLKEK